MDNDQQIRLAVIALGIRTIMRHTFKTATPFFFHIRWRSDHRPSCRSERARDKNNARCRLSARAWLSRTQLREGNLLSFSSWSQAEDSRSSPPSNLHLRASEIGKKRVPGRTIRTDPKMLFFAHGDLAPRCGLFRSPPLRVYQEGCIKGGSSMSRR